MISTIDVIVIILNVVVECMVVIVMATDTYQELYAYMYRRNTMLDYSLIMTLVTRAKPGQPH